MIGRLRRYRHEPAGDPRCRETFKIRLPFETLARDRKAVKDAAAKDQDCGEGASSASHSLLPNPSPSARPPFALYLPCTSSNVKCATPRPLPPRGRSLSSASCDSSSNPRRHGRLLRGFLRIPSRRLCGVGRPLCKREERRGPDTRSDRPYVSRTPGAPSCPREVSDLLCRSRHEREHQPERAHPAASTASSPASHHDKVSGPDILERRDFCVARRVRRRHVEPRDDENATHRRTPSAFDGRADSRLGLPDLGFRRLGLLAVLELRRAVEAVHRADVARIARLDRFARRGGAPTAAWPAALLAICATGTSSHSISPLGSTPHTIACSAPRGETPAATLSAVACASRRKVSASARTRGARRRTPRPCAATTCPAACRPPSAQSSARREKPLRT